MREWTKDELKAIEDYKQFCKDRHECKLIECWVLDLKGDGENHNCVFESQKTLLSFIQHHLEYLPGNGDISFKISKKYYSKAEIESMPKVEGF